MAWMTLLSTVFDTEWDHNKHDRQVPAFDKSRRSTSPVKTTNSLDRLKKPIRIPALAENASKQLPADIQMLYRSIYNITVNHQHFMPPTIREDIECVAKRRLPDHWFQDMTWEEKKSMQTHRGGDEDNENDNDGDDGDAPNLPSYEERRQQRQDATLPFLVHIAELDALVHLKTVADNCRRLNRHESAWNVLVHGPLFQLALPSHIKIEPVTSVSVSKAIIPLWRQRTKEVLAADSKRVDFAFTLTPRDDVEAAIRAAVTGHPPGMDMVN
ncbi:hypothetical protein QBC33DRAFT_519530 [Phialemonium atrogriseum]|uniref:PD-(D/E)XK nuclease-like domain-containing protein n=1 Tax=Phialemonium atrogriseum TaxID=1093897 RepID=A0AAJ0BQP1_9PEZI|nr:uncharacterized protein QBC33DRAFT_519530 [Phialemonium atrogriseum]KAK1762445.1 hypothetical protein QBC33DRAFT_519530 [Phialemonium atrogriseum]